MSARDELLTIAEIAVALIGFSSLIFAFRARDITQLAVRDLSAIATIIGAGSLALVFALLPLPLLYVGWSEALFWRVCSGVFALTLATSAVCFALVNRRLVRAGHPERTPRLNRTTVIVLLLLAAQLALPASALISPGPAVYLLSLIVCVLFAVAFFALLLVVARRSP